MDELEMKKFSLILYSILHNNDLVSAYKVYEEEPDNYNHSEQVLHYNRSIASLQVLHCD